jgi:hypothetical protein
LLPREGEGDTLELGERDAEVETDGEDEIDGETDEDGDTDEDGEGVTAPHIPYRR